MTPKSLSLSFGIETANLENFRDDGSISIPYSTSAERLRVKESEVYKLSRRFRKVTCLRITSTVFTLVFLKETILTSVFRFMDRRVRVRK